MPKYVPGVGRGWGGGWGTPTRPFAKHMVHVTINHL